MREKELRLALVFFGGISLAVYIHGISKEILKLVRASSVLHAIADRSQRAKANFFTIADPHDPEFDTEPVYFELLREIGRSIELRVIVDIIAGASAGGINGVMLARALAHDLPMHPLRDLWLSEADVTELLAPDGKAKAWSKWFLQPVIWGAGRTRLMRSISEREVREKLSLFVRSRWFRPPFDGQRMSELMLDGVQSMGSPRSAAASLLPTGQHLDLFVTLTDYFGYQQLIEIHDPPIIREREHRHILKFSYRRWPSGEVESDFDLDNAAALAFAARATSSFPGAFPPTQIAEIDRLLVARNLAWPTRARFLKQNFERYHHAETSPEATSFIDGSVLNNKPFSEAIQSIKGRAAYREVDRRLVYIDPDPRQAAPPVKGQRPNFFATLKGALSDIPRNEPIADELGWITGFNERVRRLKGIVDSARPQISELVVATAPADVDLPLSAEQVGRWREAVNVQVAESAGFAYEGYVRLKLSAVRAFVGELIVNLCDKPERSLSARAIAEVVETWGQQHGVSFVADRGHALYREAAFAERALPPWVRFLLEFDVGFRKRRLSFLIQGQNRLYQMLEPGVQGSGDAVLINGLKRSFYECLDSLRRRERPTAFSAETRALALGLFGEPPAAAEAKRMGDYAAGFIARRGGEIDRLIERMAAEINLDAATHDVDVLLASMDHKAWRPEIRREVLVNYLGFPFWDLLTFSVTNWRDVGEFDEIRVDRISPEDSHFLVNVGLTEMLKGTSLGHFGAFFSRSYRENDYLLGRLHAVDRLIDIVCDSCGVDLATHGVDVPALKRRAFRTVLDTEEPHLPHIAGLIADLRRALAGQH
ncbi:MAG TPA: patatin-like protein [Candidatus Sulfotelmatobacter sp.]|nr:patatin-like protein [Candidatus Sulfotelmatobacter sp.]